MDLLLHILLMLFLLFSIVFICCLFTNAIEHLGRILNLGSCAVGSIFAAIGTTLPETIVPLVAILGAYFASGNIETGALIGVGAILGSPFLIVTLAMFLCGFMIIIFAKFKKRAQDINASTELFLRDLKYFFISYITAITAGFIPFKGIKYALGVLLFCYYIFYVYKTILKAKEQSCEDVDIKNLFTSKIFRIKTTKTVIGAQIIFSLALLIISAHFFVSEIQYLSYVFNLNPLILSLLISPIATELPEITNSIIWARESKDAFALSNLTGAMVFQSTVPTAIGMSLTPWVFNKDAYANIIIVILSSVFIFTSVKLHKKITTGILLSGGLFYILFIALMTLTIF